jgi:hypothetical protein
MGHDRYWNVKCTATLASLIDSVCHAVDACDNRIDIGVWYAERLEAAAKRIRELNVEVNHGP